MFIISNGYIYINRFHIMIMLISLDNVTQSVNREKAAFCLYRFVMSLSFHSRLCLPLCRWFPPPHRVYSVSLAGYFIPLLSNLLHSLSSHSLTKLNYLIFLYVYFLPSTLSPSSHYFSFRSFRRFVFKTQQVSHDIGIIRNSFSVYWSSW